MSLRDTDYLDGARDFGGGERSVRALAAIDGGRNGTLLAMDSSTGNGIGVVRLDRRGDLTWRGDTLDADGTEKPFLLQHSFTDPAAPVPLTVGGDSWIFSSNQFYFDAGFLSKGYIDNGVHTFDLGGRDLDREALARRAPLDEPAIDAVTLRGRGFVVEVSQDTETVAVNRVRGDGSLRRTDAIDVDEPSLGFVAAATSGGSGFVFWDDREVPQGLEWARFDRSGDIRSRHEMSGDLEDWLGAPVTEMVEVDAGGRTFLVTNAVPGFIPGGGMTVLELGSDGDLELIDQETANILAGEQWRADRMTAFEMDGQDYVAALTTAGARGIVTVFAVSGDGGLVQVEDTGWDGTYPDAKDIEAIDVRGRQFLVTADDGMRAYRFKPEDYERTGSSHGNAMKGDGDDDWMSGRGGGDRMDGRGGDDLLSGGSGRDALKGGLGDDTLFGGDGRDRAAGGGGADRIHGGEDGDRLSGGGGRDLVSGGGGADQIRGGGDADRLSGGGGNDRILGGSGDDQLLDGRGRDKLSGGDGADLFVMVKDRKTDVISDWEMGDRIDLSDFGADLEFADLGLRQRGRDRVDIRAEGETIRLRADEGRLDADDLGYSDFLFA